MKTPIEINIEKIDEKTFMILAYQNKQLCMPSGKYSSYENARHALHSWGLIN